mmetsp:Transcript_10818/g.23542  ORF Transcript_10818/g.23542 Transcript_10818/m.23542 type:complete len:416 (-) Transcript_10818:224-1471(-)
MTMTVPPPTTSQQRAFAYAPMPFAAISFLSSSYVIYHLLFEEPKKLERLYHRLVLAMNVALIPLSFTQFLSTMVVPDGTENYVGAIGTVNTCTAIGFIKFMFNFSVATYYASLILQALMGLRNNFKEEKYRWIETPIHLVAYCIPCAISIVIAAHENFNPNDSGCWFVTAPRGCASDPNVKCERGQNLGFMGLIYAISNIYLYLIFPTSVALAMSCWMKKRGNDELSNNVSRGMTIVRERARKEMMRRVYFQISLYLLSFWSTWVISIASRALRLITGDPVYNLIILSNCIWSLQGFVFMVVYFTLQKMGGRQEGESLGNSIWQSFSVRREHRLTVRDIRSSAQRRIESGTESTDDVAEQRLSYHIFDGVPDPDSPWAMFFDEDDDNENEDAPDEGEQPPLNEEIEQVDDPDGLE